MKKSLRNSIYCVAQLDLIAGLFIYFYARESVRSCFGSLVFNNKLCRKTLQTFSSASSRFSFEIWLCRNSKNWSNSEPMQKKSNLNDGTFAPNNHHACTPVYSVPSPKTANKHCGIINKGNTCYVNVILQCVKVFPVLWSSNHIKSTLSPSVRKIMFLLHSAKSPIDPSFFCKSLKNAFIKVGRSSFDLHAQQDVVEVLEILLEELSGPSIVSSAAYNIKSLTSIIYHTCRQLVFLSAKIFEPCLPKF